MCYPSAYQIYIRSNDVNDEERDEILLGLKDSVKRLEVYTRAIANHLLSPTEIAEIEKSVETIGEGIVAD